MNLEDQNSTTYSSYEDAELKRLFENAETDSEAYQAIMDELILRGYDFEPSTQADDAPPPPPQMPPLRYGFWGSRLFNLIALLLSFAGAMTFVRVHTSFGELDPMLYVMVYAFVALIVSMSYLVSGIRSLANHKVQDHPGLRIPTFEYWFFVVLWYGAGGYELVTGIRNFLQYIKDFGEFDFGVSLAIAGVMPSFGMAIFGILLGTAFLYLALELRVPLKR